MNPADFTELAPGRLLTSRGFLCFVPDPLPPQLTLGMSTIQTLARAERAFRDTGWRRRNASQPSPSDRALCASRGGAFSRIEERLLMKKT